MCVVFYSTYRLVSSVNFNFFNDHFAMLKASGANLCIVCAVFATAIGSGYGFNSEVFFDGFHFHFLLSFSFLFLISTLYRTILECQAKKYFFSGIFFVCKSRAKNFVKFGVVMVESGNFSNFLPVWYNNCSTPPMGGSRPPSNPYIEGVLSCGYFLRFWHRNC